MRKRWTAGAVAVLAGSLTGVALIGIDGASALPVSRVAAFEAGAERGRAAGNGTTILLMGIDDRSQLTRDELRRYHAGGEACHCTDTLMLVHVSARQDRVSVLSLPRDSLARIPAHHDPGTGEWVPDHDAKINSAFREGGPALSVRTVEEMTGVPIDRYLQIDFRRFIDSVQQVGGVDVCPARRIDDAGTKLQLSPGKHRLNGGRSLQYVRSRKFDGAADFGRVQRQQRFLVGVLKRLQENPVDLLRLSRTLLGSIKVDQGFKDAELTSLAKTLTRLKPSATEFATVPIGGFNENIPGVGSTLWWDRERADEVFARLREDRALTPVNSQERPSEVPEFGAYEPVRGGGMACG
ncbi:LCP family protein [Streptomyces roseirectus]|uniref:LCP family protein n=1 Tax=Streptomyces roseirectus TaxID=2768066 RepID=A0A7H0IFD2_9ACTN|nr:LCP family protein [Streptomyces roseirectus]QNP71498.1 LCP family protein [Streptomyces roseirectus]